MVKDIETAERKLRSRFPKLDERIFKVTSEKDKNYNCIAWAMRLTDRWVDYSGAGSSWWPTPINEASETKRGLIDAFRFMGFECCENNHTERWFDKVALYAEPEADEWLHAARILNENVYHSKCGDDWDIHHDSAKDALMNKYCNSYSYGVVYQYMKRAKIKRLYNVFFRFVLITNKMSNEIKSWTNSISKKKNQSCI